MLDIATIVAPLFVPADRPERFTKAARSGADAIILDLEDAISRDKKVQARQSLMAGFTDVPVFVRINPPGTDWHEADVASVKNFGFQGVIVPKAESGIRLAKLALELEMPVIALIESAAGIAGAREIAHVAGVKRLAFGSIDFCADLGCVHTRDALLSARHELVLASRLGGICGPLDGVTAQVHDATVAFEDAAHAKSLGMTGKLCIHPLQISPVLSAFAPSEEEICWAQRVIASGDGAVSLDGELIDEPVRVRARTLLAAHERNTKVRQIA